MPTHSFDLLTIETGGNGRRHVKAKGFLADQKVDLCAKHPILARAAGAIARLKRQRELNLIGLEITADPQTKRISARPTGPLAPLLRREVDRIVNSINNYSRPVAMHNGGFVYTLYQPPVPSTRMVNALSRAIVQGKNVVKPTTCTLQVTARCQLDCFHCSAARFKTREREELTTEEWISVIRQSEEMGIYNIVFTGGEPLLRSDIFDLVAAVDPQRANVMMFTNGLLLTEENVSKLREAGLFSVMVSLDDPRPEVHNELRRCKDGFERTVEGIKHALEGGLLVGISTYATPETVRSGIVERMIEFAREVGVHEITIFDVVPTGKLLPLEQQRLLSEEDKERIIELEEKYNRLEDYPHVITQAYINGPKGVGCFAARVQYYMTAYGDVNPCDFTPLTFGNIRDEPLEKIWDRMLSHPAYCQPCNHCRMQDPEFRHNYIDDIPDGTLLPWPAFEELRERPNGPRPCATCATACGPRR